MERLTKSFNSFFKGEAKVAVLKGGWGVGKTYFWDSYIHSRISENNLQQIAYSYISLFGKSSLSEVKNSLFHSATPISTDSEIEKSFDEEFTKTSKLLDKVPWAKETINKAQKHASWLSWFSKNSHHVPFLGKFTNIISSLEYSLVNNYVICFDDLERKGESLSVREIMGLIDELALRKNCTVVLIFNEDSLDKETDKKEFQSYREKVVDIELLHNPSFLDNIKHAFPSEYIQLPLLIDVVGELNIKNIRVLNKIKWLINDLQGNFEGTHEEILQEFIVHAVLLAWGYYVRDEDMSFDFLKTQLNESSWMSFLSDKDEEKSPSELRYRGIASNLKLSPSEFDKHIIFYLEHGYIEDNALSEIIEGLSENIKANQVGTRLEEAWSIYSSSFSDNLDDFIAAIKNVIEEDIKWLSLPDFSSAINVVEEFDVDVDEYINTYTSIHEDTLKDIDTRDSWAMERVKSQSLRDIIEKLHEENKTFNIDDVAEKIAVNKGWNEEDIDFLASLTKQDFYDWMKSEPENLTKKARSGLLTFRRMGTSDPNDKSKYEKITENVIGALKDIASENEFNRRRIKYIYEVE